MNYYQTHKNKSPKRINRRKKRYVSPMIPLMAVASAISASEVAIITAQPIPQYSGIVEVSKMTKQFEVFNTAISGATAILEIIRTEPRRRFLATGSYGRNRRRVFGESD